MKPTQYISSDKALSEFAIKYSESNQYFDEDIAKMYLDAGIERIMTADSHKVYVISKSLNHQGKVHLPINFKYPLQIAYRDSESIEQPITRASVVEYIERNINDSCNVTISLDCDKCKSKNCSCNNDAYPIELDVTQTILGANPELMVGYNRFLIGYSNYRNSYRSNIHKGFTIIRPTTNYFFNLPTQIQECQVPCLDDLLEYRIDDGILEVNNGSIRNYPYGEVSSILEKDCTTSRSGQVLISYIGSRMDDNGFLLVPNESSVFTYLESHLLQEFAKRAYAFEKNQGSRTYWMDMQNETKMLFAKANAVLRIPNKDQWEEIMRNIMLKRKADFRTNTSGKYVPDRANIHPYTMDSVSLQNNYFNSYGTGYGR